MSLIAPNIWERTSTTTKLVVLGAVLVLIGLIFWAYSGGGMGKKEGNLLINAGVEQGKNAVISDLVTNQQEVVNNAANNTQAANNELRDSVDRPSNSFDGNRANSRFCRNFPADPSCR